MHPQLPLSQWSDSHRATVISLGTVMLDQISVCQGQHILPGVSAAGQILLAHGIHTMHSFGPCNQVLKAKQAEPVTNKSLMPNPWGSLLELNQPP